MSEAAKSPEWWRIYYDAGEYGSEDGGPFDAPRTGVVAIAQQDAWVGYQIVHSQDYYYWEPRLGGWFCTDLIGACDHLQRAAAPLVLFGRMVSAESYRATLERIHQRHGPKQGYLQTEKRR
jgi:hypothetical protein